MSSLLDVTPNPKKVYWQKSTPLGNLIGVTVASEKLADHNRQFSKDFAREGLIGSMPRAKKGTSVTIVIHKEAKTAKVVVRKVS